MRNALTSAALSTLIALSGFGCVASSDEEQTNVTDDVSAEENAASAADEPVSEELELETNTDKAVDNGGCSPTLNWGIVRAQACINSPGTNLLTSDAYVTISGSCSTCQYRFVLQMKQDIDGGVDPVVDELLAPFKSGRLVIKNKRVAAGRYYTFLRLEVKEGPFWVRVQQVESPRQRIR